MSSPIIYQDHVKMWRKELRDWLPDELFDAHLHLGPASAMGTIESHRFREALTTYSSLTWENASSLFANLYSGKKLSGVIAFGFPLREVDIDAANDYIADLADRESAVHGFILSDPKNTPRTIAHFQRRKRAGRGFIGVKPYYDLLAKSIPASCFHSRCEEFVPDDLLEFMNHEHLACMLHTGGIGVGADHVQSFIRKVATAYPNVRLILAHMGRYTESGQFMEFLRTDLPFAPNVWLETSSATSPDVYEACLKCERLWSRIIFGADVPFGLITGVEHWSDTHGPVFLTRDEYAWTDPALNRQFEAVRSRLTYNVYHTIQAIIDATRRLGLNGPTLEALKADIFSLNARRLLATCGRQIKDNSNA